jgi:hypothetical protein
MLLTWWLNCTFQIQLQPWTLVPQVTLIGLSNRYQRVCRIFLWAVLLNSELFFCRIFCIDVECRILEALIFKGILSDVGVFEFLRLPCVQLWNETGRPAMGTGALVEIDELDWVWTFYNLYVKVCAEMRNVWRHLQNVKANVVYLLPFAEVSKAL